MQCSIHFGNLFINLLTMARIYDVRMGAPVAELRSYTSSGAPGNCGASGAGKKRTSQQTVSDVAYSPVHPQVATASFDGHVRFFSERQAAGVSEFEFAE